MLAMQELNYVSGTALIGLVGAGLIGAVSLAVGGLGSDFKGEKLDKMKNKNFVEEMFLKYKDEEMQGLGKEEYKNFVEEMKTSDSELIHTLEKVSSKFRKTDISSRRRNNRIVL